MWRRRCCARASRCTRPLRHWMPGEHAVAIIGLGGLGHMGVVGRRDGADVTVLSQSLKKMEDGLRFGAKSYYATADPDTFRSCAAAST